MPAGAGGWVGVDVHNVEIGRTVAQCVGEGSTCQNVRHMCAACLNFGPKLCKLKSSTFSFRNQQYPFSTETVPDSVL